MAKINLTTPSSNRPDPHTGLIADRTARLRRTGQLVRVVEISADIHPPGAKSWRGDGTNWHPQIAWKWKEGDRERTGTVQSYPATTDGPWQFMTVGNRVVLWGDAAELEGQPAPAWMMVGY